jgi:hypothetical protein
MSRLGVLSLVTATLVGCSGGGDATSTKPLLGPNTGECGPTETHVFGIYNSPTGGVTIEIARPGKHILVLSAHDATTWHITTTDPDAVIEEVYAVGYDDQTIDVSGLANTPKVTVDSKETTGSYGCGYSWPYDGKGCDTGDMLRLAAFTLDRGVNSYDGCYSTDSVMLDDRMHAYTSCTSSYDDGLPKNHFIADCSGGDEGSCGYEGGGEGSGSASSGGGGGGSAGSGMFF